MDPYDLEPTPEEQQAALIQAIKIKMGGQQPEQADAYRAWGNLGQLTGDRVLAPFGQSQIHQAEAMDRGDGALLMKMLASRKVNANSANAANQGMDLAVKNQFPQVWQSLSGQGLSDASWGKVYMQENAKDRTTTAQTGADRRVHFTQEKTGERFEKTNALHTQKQAADLGAREVYGASPMDPTNIKPISQGQAEDLQDQASARDIIRTKGSEMLELYKQPGALVPGTTPNTKLNAAIASVLPQILKTEAVGGMTEGHQQLVHAMIDNPTKLANFLNDERLPTMIQDAMKSAESNVEHRANSLGRTFAKGQKKSGGFDLNDKAHQDALDWAKKNPKDPRAQKILMLNGVANGG